MITSEMEKIARECANIVMMRYSSGQRGYDIIKPILGALAQACDPLADIESAVCEDIKARQLKGIAKYGTTVTANPLSQRAWLIHAYEETLDLAIYLKKVIKDIS